jgi:hypothetical protein
MIFHRRVRNITAIALLTLSLGSCAWLQSLMQPEVPITKPQTAQQSTAYAYTQIAGLYNLLADLTTRGRISVPDAKKALANIDELRAALDVASASGDAKGLASVTQGLIAIETTLKARASQ